jgi:hypothetical protein
MEGYKTFVEESLVGDKEVMARIQGNHFELMPIGVWPVKGQSATACMGQLIGTIEARDGDSRIDLWYRMPLLWTVFITAFFLVACLFSLIWASIPSHSSMTGIDRLANSSFIVGFPSFALLFAVLGLAAARKQSELLRCFVHQLLEDDPDIDALQGTAETEEDLLGSDNWT